MKSASLQRFSVTHSFTQLLGMRQSEVLGITVGHVKKSRE